MDVHSKQRGLPTKVALKVLVEKMGVPDSKVRSRIRDSQLVWTKRSKKVATLEFYQVHKSMGVIVCEHNEYPSCVEKWLEWGGGTGGVEGEDHCFHFFNPDLP
ncbi:putative ovule protein [Forsythia ovata]|uniref:Ovule protein n=1 Tax=Forsythia ovata TaxID=205694 RepID=A0ABD1RPS4_9LAMI